jgi:RimJ/RimL family protein N-acetyltransferase
VPEIPARPGKGTIVNVTLPRVSLCSITEDVAASAIHGKRRPGQEWAREYPMIEELDFLRSLIFERRAGIDPGVFTHYQVCLRPDNMVVGWATFFGGPDEFKAVEIAFGIVPDYAGHRFGAEVVAGMVDLALHNGAQYVIASTRIDDVAAQEALVQGGMNEVVRDTTIAHFAASLAA